MSPVSFPMSPAKPLPTPTSPPPRHPISPAPSPHFRSSFAHRFVTPSPHSSALPQNRSPYFQYLTHSSQLVLVPLIKSFPIDVPLTKFFLISVPPKIIPQLL